MFLFGRNEPAAGLFADDVLLSVNQSPDGEPAFVRFGYRCHYGKFPIKPAGVKHFNRVVIP
jgi:hypothetical protein